MSVDHVGWRGIDQPHVASLDSLARCNATLFHPADRIPAAAATTPSNAGDMHWCYNSAGNIEVSGPMLGSTLVALTNRQDRNSAMLR
jgi:hypothetical protein